jgi:hypothetical protein
MLRERIRSQMLYPIELWMRPFGFRRLHACQMSQFDDLILASDAACLDPAISSSNLPDSWQKTKSRTSPAAFHLEYILPEFSFMAS